MPSKDTQFKAGNPGRPPGSGDKQFIRTEFWLGRYWESLQDLPEDQKLAKIEFIIDKFFAKIQTIAASPTESTENAKSALDLIKGLESRSEEIGSSSAD